MTSSFLAMLPQQDSEGGAVAIVFLLVQLALMVAVIGGGWKMFAKAGEPGWAILVPIYNIYVITKITGKPAWWIVMLMIPIANIIFSYMLMTELAKVFGKGTGFGIGLWLVGFIFIPILGFGDAQYKAPAAAA